MIKAFLRDKKNIVILLLALLVYLKGADERTHFLRWIMAGVLWTSLWDFLINKLFWKKNIFPKSAIITGFILSGVLDYRQPLWVLMIFSGVAIVSKYVLRLDKKHIFNPANTALFIATICQLPLTWTIETNVYIIIGVGVYLAYSLRKFSHIISFLILFIGLFGLGERANPLLVISWFFLFIMLIEPKTSGVGTLRGFIFGAIAGLSSFLSFKLLPGKDFYVVSLFMANLFNLVLDKLFRNEKGRRMSSMQERKML